MANQKPGDVLLIIRRFELSLSQSGLARRLGCAQCTVSRLESGQRFSRKTMDMLSNKIPKDMYNRIMEAIIEESKRHRRRKSNNGEGA